MHSAPDTWCPGPSGVVVGSVVSGRGLVRETVRLVDKRGRDLTKLVFVFAGMVCTEVQLATGLELDLEVGLRSATVAAVSSTQRCGTRGNGSGHIGLISTHRCLDQRI